MERERGPKDKNRETTKCKGGSKMEPKTKRRIIFEWVGTVVGVLTILFLLARLVDFLLAPKFSALSTQINGVVTVMNREVIPVINQWKDGGPDIKPLALSKLSKKMTQALSTLRAMDAKLKRIQRVQVLAASRYLDPTKNYKRGDSVRPSWRGNRDRMWNLIVRNPESVNETSEELRKVLERIGIEVVKKK